MMTRKETIHFLHTDALIFPQYDGEEGNRLCALLQNAVQGEYIVEEVEGKDDICQLISKGVLTEAERIWYLHGCTNGAQLVMNSLKCSSTRIFPLCLHNAVNALHAEEILIKYKQSSPYVLVAGAFSALLERQEKRLQEKVNAAKSDLASQGSADTVISLLLDCLLEKCCKSTALKHLYLFPLYVQMFATNGVGLQAIVPLLPFMHTLSLHLLDSYVGPFMDELRCATSLHTLRFTCGKAKRILRDIVPGRVPLKTLVYVTPSCKVPEEDWESIIKMLSSSEGVIEDLRVCGRIGVKEAVQLATGLKGNTSLTSLDLSSNVVGSMGACAIATALRSNVTLQHLNLSRNHLSSYPEELSLCQNSSLGLSLKGNQIQFPPQSIVNKWETVQDVIDFSQRSRGKQDCVRLILVGYGGVGKTRLVRALKVKEPPADVESFLAEDRSTQIIDISTMHIMAEGGPQRKKSPSKPRRFINYLLGRGHRRNSEPLSHLAVPLSATTISSPMSSPSHVVPSVDASSPPSSDLNPPYPSPSSPSLDRFLVWDFAGQMEYYHIHRHFLPYHNAVYVIVVKLSVGAVQIQKQVQYWLNFMQSQIDVERRHSSQPFRDDDGSDSCISGRDQRSDDNSMDCDEIEFARPSLLIVGTFGETLADLGWDPNSNRSWLKSLRETYSDSFDIYDSVYVVNYFDWNGSVPSLYDVIVDEGRKQFENGVLEWQLPFTLFSFLMRMEKIHLYLPFEKIYDYISTHEELKQHVPSAELLIEALEYLDLQGYIIYRKKMVFPVPQKLFAIMANFVQLLPEVAKQPRQKHIHTIRGNFRGELTMGQILEVLVEDGCCSVAEVGEVARAILEIMREFKLCSPLADPDSDQNITYFFPSHLLTWPALESAMKETGRESDVAGIVVGDPDRKERLQRERALFKKILVWRHSSHLEGDMFGVEWLVKEKHVDHFPPGLFAGMQIRLLGYIEEHPTEFHFDGFLVDSALFELEDVQVLLRVDASRGIWMIVKRRNSAVDSRNVLFLSECVNLIEEELRNSYHKGVIRNLMCPACLARDVWHNVESNHGKQLYATTKNITSEIAMEREAAKGGGKEEGGSLDSYCYEDLSYSVLVNGRSVLLHDSINIVITHVSTESVHFQLQKRDFGFLCSNPLRDSRSLLLASATSISTSTQGYKKPHLTSSALGGKQGVQWVRVAAHGFFHGSDYPRLQSDGDYDGIAEANFMVFGESPAPVVKHIISTKPQLISALMHCDKPCTALHMNGHGVKGVGILAKQEESSEKNILVPLRDIAVAVRNRSLSFVFFNACNTYDIATSLVEQKCLRCAIGTRANVPDPGYGGMKLFVSYLYTKLMSGCKVQHSFESACMQTIEELCGADGDDTAMMTDEVLAFLGGEKSGRFIKENCKYILVGDGNFPLWPI